MAWNPHFSILLPVKTAGVPDFGTPAEFASDGTSDYFSPLSTTFTLSFRAAWAAASLAMGTR